MCEVSRLLSLRKLSTTPYHPICNGLVEKFNGTLKGMLKTLCDEKSFAICIQGSFSRVFRIFSFSASVWSDSERASC